MGLLDGKRVVVTGVLTEASLAFSAARLAQAQGAEIVLTGFGRGLRITERTARKLDTAPDVLEVDVTVPDHIDQLASDLGSRWSRVDGVLHSIAFAPEPCLGGAFMDVDWEDAATALHVSSFSYKALAGALRPLMPAGGSVVGLTFDGTVAWPAYDWMGVAKAALESINRYVARELGPEGIRVNLVAAGPIRSMAAKSIPGFESFEEAWATRAPMGWDVNDSDAVARAVVALLSDWFPATTGEVIHVDGGYHAMGA